MQQNYSALKVESMPVSSNVTDNYSNNDPNVYEQTHTQNNSMQKDREAIDVSN
jgi:hypothetical protein